MAKEQNANEKPQANASAPHQKKNTSSGGNKKRFLHRRPSQKKKVENKPLAEQSETVKKETEKKQEENKPLPEKQNRKPSSQNRRGKTGGKKTITPPKKAALEALLPAAEDAAAPAPSTHREKPKNTRGKSGEKLPAGKLKIISLGGLNEIGKNLTVLEYEDDIIVVDCGLGFPDDDMLGIDLVIPDFSYLEQNREKIRGVFFTHGHEDHIGAVPYLLRTMNPPLYGTRLTLGIIKNKLEEHQLPNEPKLMCTKAGDVIRAGAFSVEFIHVNHSIADACCLAIKTPLGTVIHTGDFKLDVTPIDGEIMNLTRLGELGKEGVLCLLCESTNAERPGYTPSEKKVGKSLEYIFETNKEKRIVIATFSSNVHRVQQIIDTSVRHGRKVAVTGRSMLNTLGAAIELGYMNVPEDVLIDISEIKRYKPEQLTLITTGSQGEPMSALYRMAFGDHAQVSLGQSDLVVLSASAIPGNEKLVGRIINELTKNGVSVIHDAAVEVHVSGHACQEELKLMQALTKPQYFMPIHGEFRHLAANRALAQDMGMPDNRIFISDIGKVFEIDRKGARFNGTVPAGNTLVDGYGVGDVGNIVLRDRKHLSQDGLIVVVATIDADMRMLLSGPDIVSRGFVYVRESESLMDNVKQIAAKAIDEELRDGASLDRMEMKTRIRDDLSKFLYAQTKRKPMILPIVMEL